MSTLGYMSRRKEKEKVSVNDCKSAATRLDCRRALNSSSSTAHSMSTLGLYELKKRKRSKRQ
jgi:hypothetical protein